jgi:plastocyanin
MPGITIKKIDGKTVFQPDRPGANPGDPLEVVLGDLVTWNNETDDPHHPVATDPAGPFLTNEIPPGGVSSPIFNVTQTPPKTIAYTCSLHADEKGSIKVT